MTRVRVGWLLSGVLSPALAAQGTGMCDGQDLLADPVRASCQGGAVGANVGIGQIVNSLSGPITGPGGGGSGPGGGSGGVRGEEAMTFPIPSVR